MTRAKHFLDDQHLFFKLLPSKTKTSHSKSNQDKESPAYTVMPPAGGTFLTRPSLKYDQMSKPPQMTSFDIRKQSFCPSLISR